MPGNHELLRKSMIKNQLIARGINNQRVLDAFARVPRHLFVSPELREQAYDDNPLPIASNQTISQPYIVALMTECLKLEGQETVLEVGTGSGYQTAILAELAGHVYTIERFTNLSETAQSLLENLGYTNISFRVGDGSKGWSEAAPFEGILIAAAARRVPPALTDQLSTGGRLVIPVGDSWQQKLLVVSKDREGSLSTQKEVGCRFLPLIEE
ncbi:MAG: protein-L-isoaspartate O-methyltransferase [Firmicutes bacterium ML8_F2]|jgi:protein-L-isoaspartate(D-aspartate) O-methyltransferase|nr:MAG: protein-L-isoaspartate O-methyltransferase [Firmicutes bacterium ML8_F2]